MRTSKLFSCVKVPPPGHCFTDVYDNYVWIYAKNFQLIFGKSRLRSGNAIALRSPMETNQYIALLKQLDIQESMQRQ